MATEPVTTEGTYSEPEVFAEEAKREHVHGVGPWRLGLRRLRRNKVALAFGFLFVLLVAVCLAAPVWADKVAKTGPNENHLTDQIVVDGKKTNVVALDGVPIGPTWQGEFFLGADTNGRDVMVRLLYGGRNSLVIGLAAALMTTLLSISARHPRRLLRRQDRRRHQRGARRDLGVPRGDPRRCARRGAGARRPEARADHHRRQLAARSRSS